MLGSSCAAVAALLTALKTGNILLWPCAVLIIGIGTFRAFQMRKYERRTSVLTFEQAKHWEPRYAIGAMLYAGVLGIWCFITIFGNDDAVAHHGVRRRDDRLHRWRRGPQLRPSDSFSITFCCPAVRCRWRWRSMAASTTSALLCCWCCFSSDLKDINLSLHAIFVKALTSSFREAALAGQFDTALNNMPHGLCMFRADGRLAVMNHRFSEMMQSVRRSPAARRQRA